MSTPSSRGLTRRAALTGVAGAGAAALLEPVTGLADTLTGRGPVFSRVLGSIAGDSPPLRAPRQFSLIGIEWSAPSAARIELRARGVDGRWSGWVLASALGHGPDVVRDRSRLFGEPIWTGAALSVQVRASKPVRGVRLHFVDPGAPPAAAPRAGAAAAAPLPLAAPIRQAGRVQPPIIARSAWADGGSRPSVPEGYGSVRLAFVHHTVSPNGYASGDVPSILRSIFDYHRYVRGFHDIAYNFMIDAFGRIWEARAGGIDLPVIGAQAGGYNAVSTGVAVVGTFMDVALPAAAIAALERLLAWKLSLHGLPTRGRVTVEVNPAEAFYTPFAPGAHVSLPRIAGHRDGDSTDCPGNTFYARLPAIRVRATALAPTRATPPGPRPRCRSRSEGLSGRRARRNRVSTGRGTAPGVPAGWGQSAPARVALCRPGARIGTRRPIQG